MSNKVQRRCEIDGVEYPSITEAAAVYGFSYQLVSARLRNDRFPTWKLLGKPTRKTIGLRGTTFVVHGVSYPKRTVAAITLGCSEAYISKLVDDPKREDCYRILPNGKKFKNIARFQEAHKTMLRAIKANQQRKAAELAAARLEAAKTGKMHGPPQRHGRPSKPTPDHMKETLRGSRV